MFIKPFKIKSNILVTGSEKKRLRQRVMAQFNRPDEETGTAPSPLAELFGNRAKVCTVKLITYHEEPVTVYTSDKRPIFFELNGKLLPTVYTLWSCPDLVPAFTTHATVLPKLANGADLMIPGVVKKGTNLASWGRHQKDDVVAVNLTSNRAAVGVGLLAHSNKISAIDIDIYANKLVDESHVEEVADLLYKFRLTEETSSTLDSTHHALVRNYLDHRCYGQLIEVLNNRIGYGVFLDEYSANLTLDQLLKGKEFRYAARVATLLALQEDFSNPITKALALYSCYRYAKAPDAEHFDDLAPAEQGAGEAGEGQKKKKKEEIKVRVKFLRNEYFDDHFDLTDSQLLLGKTFVELGRAFGGAGSVIGTSCELLGLTMYKKYEQACEFVKQNAGKELNEEALQMIRSTLEKEPNKEDEQLVAFTEVVDKLEASMKIGKDSFEKLILEQVKQSVGEHEKQQIEAQAKVSGEGKLS